MKKIFTLFLCLAMVLGAKAQNSVTYTEPLTVTVNGNENKQDNAAVTVTMNADGTVDLTLLNFMLISTEESGEVNTMPIGNISVKALTLTPSEDSKYYSFERTETIVIEEGDSQISPMWLATSLPPIPIVMKGQMNTEHIYATLDIDLQEQLEQMVYVVVGTPISSHVAVLQQAESLRTVRDLSGRRLPNGKMRGILIVGGKKVVIK